MTPLRPLTDEERAARRAEYETAFRFSDEDRAPSEAATVVVAIVICAAFFCLGFLIGRLL